MKLSMISVLLPAYNSSSTIHYALRSILLQSYRDFEVLVLDDGSTDDTEKIVLNIGDSRVKYHKLPHRGLTAALNSGLEIARYDIIARMDADDLSVPNRFYRQWNVLQQLPENSILSSWYSVFTERKIHFVVTPPTTSAEIKKGLLLHSFISHPGLMCRKRIMIESGGYRTDAEIDAFQDYETWLRIKGQVEFSILPEVLVFQRYRKESLSNNLSYKQQVLYKIQEPYYADLKRHFALHTVPEQELYRGWREYFYGKRQLARKHWIRAGGEFMKSPRAILAWILTLFPENLFVLFKEKRWRFRLSYRLRYFSRESRDLRKTLWALTQDDPVNAL